MLCENGDSLVLLEANTSKTTKLDVNSTIPKKSHSTDSSCKSFSLMANGTEGVIVCTICSNKKDKTKGELLYVMKFVMRKMKNGELMILKSSD